MSDPVTNVEIEDVLSSIRRLVSDGDKARTRDSAPISVEDTPARDVPESFTSHDATEDDVADHDAQPDNRTEKLVLTPAFLVVDGGEARDAKDPQSQGEQSDIPPEDDHHQDEGEQGETHDDDSDSHHDDGSHDEDHAEPSGEDDQQDHHDDAENHHESDDQNHEHDSHDDQQDSDTSSDEGSSDEFDADDLDDPVPLSEMVWESVEDAKMGGPARDALQAGKVTDRSELAATIAELEAAVSACSDDYELDGSEDMGEAIAWPGAVRKTEGVEDAETDDTSIEANEPAGAEQNTDADPSDTAAQDDTSDDDPDIYADDDLDGLLDAGGVTLDEAALRELVGEVVREELSGPLGERITRNVRKLVRREIYRVLSSQEFD